MTRLQQLLGVVLLFIASITALGIWSILPSRTDDALSRPSQWQGLRVGYAIEAPYAYLDESGRVTGEAPEVFRAVADRVGIRDIDWVRMDFASLLPELLVGRVDVVATGLFVTEAREQIVAFSRPTARVFPALVYRETDKERYEGVQHLRDLVALEHGTWAVLNSAFEEERLQREGLTEAHLQRMPHVTRAFRALQEAQVDGFFISGLTARQHQADLDAMELRFHVLEGEPAGRPAFAFRQKDHALRVAINAELARYLGSVEHQELVARFGVTKVELDQ